jgi:hypothetical protein
MPPIVIKSILQSREEWVWRWRWRGDRVVDDGDRALALMEI